MTTTMTPLGVMVRGVAAAAAGTAAMDALMYSRYRKDDGTQTFLEWEFSAGVTDWSGAAAPAQVGKRVVEGVFQTELAPKWARLTNNVMHWGYGLAWGAKYGTVAGSFATPKARYGLALGSTVWGSGYVVLPMAKLYKPIWEYDSASLLKDLSAHMLYGVTTAAAFRILCGRKRSSSIPGL